MHDWKIKVQERTAMYLTDIFVYRETSQGILVWSVDPKKNTVTEKVYDLLSYNIPASFTLPTDLLKPLLQALLSKGIKPDEQSFVEGKLEATESHLKDMRKLLKLEK